MNFNEILAATLSLVSRPDKAVAGGIAINKAISYCTIKGEFPEDLIEASISIDASLYGDTISLTSLTRFRRFSYVKPTGLQRYLTLLEPDKIFTPGGIMQRDVYYRSGTGITYTLKELTTALEVAYYSYPLVLDASNNPTHWMLDKIPYCIIDLAAARLFAGIGDDTSAKRHEAYGMDCYETYKRDLAQER